MTSNHYQNRSRRAVCWTGPVTRTDYCWEPGEVMEVHPKDIHHREFGSLLRSGSVVRVPATLPTEKTFGASEPVFDTRSQPSPAPSEETPESDDDPPRSSKKRRGSRKGVKNDG